MNKFFYFKVTFLSITAGLFAGLVVYGLFDVDFSSTEALKTLFFRSLLIAVVTGLIMGLLNMFFQIGNFRKPENKS